MQRAVRARKLYHDLCEENERNVKFWLRSNQAKNVPVSTEHINLAEEMFKVDVATGKGKSTRPHPPVVDKNDIVELPPELRVQGMKLELAMDVFYCNDQSFKRVIFIWICHVFKWLILFVFTHLNTSLAQTHSFLLHCHECRKERHSKLGLMIAILVAFSWVSFSSLGCSRQDPTVEGSNAVCVNCPCCHAK